MDDCCGNGGGSSKVEHGSDAAKVINSRNARVYNMCLEKEKGIGGGSRGRRGSG